MEPIVMFLLSMLVVTAVSLAGAFLPFVRKLTDRQIHLLISLSAGIFLGILFLMLLPQAIHESIHGGYEPITVMTFVLGGFLVILAADLILRHYHMQTCACGGCNDTHGHNLASLSAFIGLSVHAAVDGIALAAAMIAGEEIGTMAIIGMCLHKLVVLFSLSSTFLLSDRSKKDIFTYLVAFSLITPIAGIISFLAMGSIAVEGIVGLFIAFAAGTFMFVALCDMLPEAFHRKDQDLRSYILVVLGIVIVGAIILITGAMGHVH